MHAQRFPARRQVLEQRGDQRDGDAEAIAPARRIGLARDREQAFEVRQISNRLPRVVAPRVPRDLLRTGDEAHGRRAREQRERPADMRVRNRIAIPVEVDVRGLAGDDGAQHLGVEGMRGQREEARLLLREDLRDGLITLLGMGTLMRNLLAPATKLRVQIIDIRKRPRGKERVAEVLNLSLSSV